MRIDKFGGTRTRVAPAKLKAHEFPTDEGSDRFETERWARRRGMLHTNLAKYAGSISQMMGFDLPGTEFAVMIVEGTNIQGATSVGEREAATAAVTNTLLAAYSDSHRASMAEFRRHGYINNGWDKMRRWDGRASSAVLAGIAGPSTDDDTWTPSSGAGFTEAAGDCAVGPHFVRYRYLDSTTGYVSNPSEEREIEVTAGNGKVTFDVDAAGGSVTDILRSTDAKADKIVVEMTTIGSTEYFKAGEGLMTASTLVVDISDPALAQQFIDWPSTGHDVPPVGKNLVSHGSRLWVFGQVVHDTGTCTVSAATTVDKGSTDPDWRASALGDSTAATPAYPSVAWHFQVDGDTVSYEIDTYDESDAQLDLKKAYVGSGTNVGYKIFSRSNVIWVSEPGYPESFSPLKFINGPNGEGAGDLTAGVGFRNSMIFFTPNGTFALSWDEGPLVDAVQTPLSNKSGALNQGVVIEVENTIYSMDRRGWYAWSGVTPKLISQPVDAIRDSIDYAQSEEFHAAYLPELRAIRWFVTYTGDTAPKNYVQFDIDSGTWSTGSYYQEITASRLVPSAEGLKVLYGDSSGHVWVADKGTADGVTSDDSHRVASGTPTTTVIDLSTSTLPTADGGVTGCFAYHVGIQEARLITGNTASQLTVSAFSTAPVAGDEIWIGPIPSKLKTKAFRAQTLKQKQKTRKVWFEFKPVTRGKLQVRVFEDLSTTAKTWATATGRNTTQEDGVEWPGENAAYPSTDWILDLSHSDGMLEIPIGSEWNRYFQLELELQEPDVALELHTIESDGHSIADDE